MGMLLRRHDRVPELNAKVNGKPVPQKPKTKVVSPNEKKVNEQPQPKVF
jgi:hypothetical protein